MNYGLRAFLDLAGRVPNVGLAHDIVAREHGVCLVAGDFPRRLLRDSPANHVPHSGASKIMEQQAGKFGSFCERVPRPAKVSYWLAILPREKKIFRLLPPAKLGNQDAAFFGEHNDARLPVLCFSAVEGHGVVEQVYLLAAHL